LYRIAAAGGTKPVETTRLGSGQAAHRFPFFLPDGRRFLFFATGTSENQGVYVGSLDSMEATRLLEADTHGVFVPPDLVLFGRNESLYAQRVSRDLRAPIGKPMIVAERLARNPNTFASAALAASAAGVFGYRPTTESAARELRWVTRSGQQMAAMSITGLLQNVHLSPDARMAAMTRSVGGNDDVWLVELARGVLRRFTFDAGNESTPRWSPDGSRIAFNASRQGGGLNDLFVKSLRDNSEELLLQSSENKNVHDWSPDGRFVLYSNQSPKTARDLWVLPLEGDRKPFEVVHTPFEETLGRFSPDGRWIAYASNESGRFEIYVHPFPGPGRNWQISTNGGMNAEWRGDGREIFYIAPDNRLMAVPVTLSTDTSTVEAGAPSPLFNVRPATNYSAARDGQRFLLNTPTGDNSVAPITIVLNWKPPAR
jgi:Tol biopolymer transport system component